MARELYEEIMLPTSTGDGFTDRLATWGIGQPSNEVDSFFPEPMQTDSMPVG